jgi:hypothetical protein
MRTVVFEGASPNKLVCDTTLRRMPDGSWVMVMLGGGDKEPLPQNDVYLTRSLDEGRTWSAMERVKLGIKEKDANVAVVPTELSVVHPPAVLEPRTSGRSRRSPPTTSSTPRSGHRAPRNRASPAGELGERTFMRPMIRTRDGRLVLPFQHYLGPGPTQDPRNGVLISPDEGATWTRHGSIRSSTDDRKYSAWAENTVAELSGGELVMFCRAEKGRGRLLEAFSEDGGVMAGRRRGKQRGSEDSPFTLWAAASRRRLR